MNLSPADALEEMISSTERLRATLRGTSTRQVKSSDERALIKATALAWFKNHRPTLTSLSDDALFVSVDTSIQQLLELSERNTTRARYLAHLLTLKHNLVKLRSQALTLSPSGSSGLTGAEPPDFSKLVVDRQMTAILQRRWAETISCLEVGAHLAATVMMGALLEALLLARANKLDDKSKLFKAKAAPKDAKNNNPLPLTSWTLRHYIDVAHELKWIGRSAKDVGVVLRDYRNYIHPEKELKHGVVIDERETHLLWTIFQTLAKQVIQSI